MLTRTATRRCAAVLMMALVAMLLVATGGSARAAQPRTSAGTGQAVAPPQHARQVAAIAPAAHEHVQIHLDLASTPPADGSPAPVRAAERTTTADASHVAAAEITVDGRAPPAP